MVQDEALVDSAGAGDIDAFAELVRRHRAVVYAVAARVVGDGAADDVTQDSFLRAFHRLDQFRREAPFRTWLLQITHNVALSEVARTKAETVEDVEGTGAAPAEAPAQQPAELLERSERRDRLAAKIGQLRDAHRAVLVLRDLEGLSYEEIATVTGTPIGTVRGRLHRARSELTEILRNNTYDWEIPR